MSLESLFARALNSTRQPSPRTATGLYLGESRALIGNEQGPLSLPHNPPQHMFLSGRTGTGKTKLLLKIMTEYRRAGIAYLFIDLHGQATDELLGLIASKG